MHRAAVASTSTALRGALAGPSAVQRATGTASASSARHLSHVARPRQSPRPVLRASATASPFASSSSRTFATSSSRRSAGGTKSPFQAFVDTLKEELAKSQQMQENVRQLQGEAGKMQDSETMKRMREAYERARIITSIKENPRLQKAADALRKSGGQVGDAVGATLKQMEESELIKGLSAISSSLARQLAESTAPVRNTEAYKALSQTLVDAFDDGGSALRIYTDAELDARQARRIKREARLRKIGRSPPLKDVESDEAIAVVMMAGKDPADLVNEDPMAAAAMAAEAEAKAKAAGGAKAAEGAEGAAEEGGAKPKAEGEDGAEGDGAEAEKPKPAPKPAAPRPRVAGFAARTRGVKENAEAGEALVLKEEPKYKQAWSSFRETSSLARKMAEWREAYDESENPVVERIRGITETIGGWFQENETAQVVGAMRMMDPSFTLDGFQKELREYVVPEIIDAYHGAARHLLKQWCGEATYNVLLATIDPFLQKGLTAHGRLLDVRNIDILQARMLENNVPVLVVSFSSQELMYFKDPKTGEVKAGREDQADLCRYAMVLTRVEEEMDNEITGGWKVVELARRGQAAFL